MRERSKPDRTLLAGLFVGGLIYVLFVLSQGRSDIGVVIALIIEVALLYRSLLSSSINKKELALICFGIIIYTYLTIFLGVFSEVVLMACGGLAAFAFVMSSPKFPMTKRALVTGVGVGVIMTFLGIYLALKLGVVYFVGAEMLGAIILSVYGKYTPEENTIVVAISNGSSMIAMGVLITFPAIAIFRPEIADSLITYPFIAFVTGVSAMFGMLLLVPVRDRFENEAWPQIRPQAECIQSLGADKSARKPVLTGLAAASLWTAGTRVAEAATGESFSTVPQAFGPIVPVARSVPDWIGLSNSPLIAAIGFFVGWKRTLVLVIGSLASFTIWVVLEGAQPIDFGSHLHRPEILYLVIGVFAAVIAGDVLSSKTEHLESDEFDRLVKQQMAETRGNGQIIEYPHKSKEIPTLLRVKQELFSLEVFKEELRVMATDPRGYLKSRRGQLPTWVAFTSMVLFIITGIIVFWFIRPFAGLEVHWLLFIVGSPVVLVSSYFTARAISETGMLAGYISDVVAIPAILFFRVTFQAITTFMSMLGALQDAAIAVLVHLKLGRLTGVRGRDIMKAVFVGAILGTFVGSLITYVLFVTYGFGGTDFPSPAAQLFGFLVNSLAGLGNLQLPGLDMFPDVHPLLSFGYLLAFGIVGGLSGRELTKRGLSPMSLAVGLLIPPATSMAILIGGIIDYRMNKDNENGPDTTCEIGTESDEKYERTSRLLSGVVAGEAIVTVVWVLWTAIAFLF